MITRSIATISHVVGVWKTPSTTYGVILGHEDFLSWSCVSCILFTVQGVHKNYKLRRLHLVFAAVFLMDTDGVYATPQSLSYYQRNEHVTVNSYKLIGRKVYVQKLF